MWLATTGGTGVARLPPDQAFRLATSGQSAGRQHEETAVLISNQQFSVSDPLVTVTLQLPVIS